MKVTISPIPGDAVHKIAMAARICTSESIPKESTYEKDVATIRRCIECGHLSVLEHVSVSFVLQCVSRGMTHQLVRHRLCAFSQQSQRYVKFDEDSQFIFPPSVASLGAKAIDTYLDAIRDSMIAYRKLIDAGAQPEDARYVLPNAMASNIAMTCNLRELIHICNERLCRRAQWEIRECVSEMANLVSDRLPWMKLYLVPKCMATGYCTEKNGCGMTRRKEDENGKQ